MRVAIVHYWLVGMRGGEKVLESLCRMYPQADIFTHCVDSEKISDTLRKHRIQTTCIGKLPYSTRYYKWCLPLMPWALEQLDLRGYDLVISLESGPAKGVIVRADVPHLCYCHTPMRYLWDCTQDYLEHAGWLSRFFMRLFFHYLRVWDVVSANRPDRIVANSHTVARRIRRWWQKEAAVVHPPVELERFAPSADVGDAYLCFSELVDYKRIDLAVKAATLSGRKLVIAGEGEERARLQQIAGSTVSFVGRVDNQEAAHLLSTCRALLFPGEEDFGIVPLEVMASGRPVIAYGRGGALETVVDGETGLFFAEQTPESLLDALDRFEALEAEGTFVPAIMVARAAQFSEARFHQEMQREIACTIAQCARS